MEKLKILHTESSCGWGGQEIRILTEMQAFKSVGHDVMLLAPKESGIYTDAIKRGLNVKPAPIGRKNLRGLIAMRRALLDERYDVINTHSSTDSWLSALACLLVKNTPPIVRTRHVSTAINNKFVTRWLYTQATKHIVITGEALRQRLINENDYNANLITSIPTGIDLTYYKPLDKNECRIKLGVANRPTIGILATLRDWKGHDYLLDAFLELKKTSPQWQILVVGDGPRREHLQNRINEMGLENDVFLVGNQSNVPEWMACFDIFALPSFGEEGVPQSVMQAMACGLPVVSTTVGAIREAVIENGDNQTGIIIIPRDAQALKEALETLMNNEGLRAKFSNNAIKSANERFGIEKMREAMESIFLFALKI